VIPNLILSGGPGHHPYSTTSARLAWYLSLEGFTSDVTEDIEAGLTRLADGCYGLLTVNALRWRMDESQYAAEKDRWAFSLSPEGRAAILAHVERGGPVLAVHTAPICFDDWPEWGDIVGAQWVWGTSNHPPLGLTQVRVNSGVHEIVDGAGDFEVVDEVYSHLDVRPDVKPLATGHHDGIDHPLLWARQVVSPSGEGAGARVVYDALGHDERSLDHPVHRAIIRRAARWLLGAPCDP
jgi:type 1 glutamine amidotransferase